MTEMAPRPAAPSDVASTSARLRSRRTDDDDCDVCGSDSYIRVIGWSATERQERDLGRSSGSCVVSVPCARPGCVGSIGIESICTDMPHQRDLARSVVCMSWGSVRRSPALRPSMVGPRRAGPDVSWRRRRMLP